MAVFRCFFGRNKFSRPNGQLSPIACHTYLESYQMEINQKINLTTVLRWDTVTISLLLHLLPLNCPFHPSGVCSRFTHMRFAFPPPSPFKQINVSGQVTLAGGACDQVAGGAGEGEEDGGGGGRGGRQGEKVGHRYIINLQTPISPIN